MTTNLVAINPEPSPSAPEIPWAWIKCVRDMCDVTKNGSQLSAVEDKKLPVPLLPWLYLGDRQSARRLARGNKSTAAENGVPVTHILALHPVAPYEEADMQERLKGSGVCHMRINCNDTEGYDMIGKHWDACRDFLASVRTEYYEHMETTKDTVKASKDTSIVPRVLVHCVAGINRSGLIACAAHMVLERQPVLEVVQSCAQQRGSVLWNRSFQKQLCQLAQKEGLLGPMPEGYDNTEPNSWDNLAPPPPAHNVVISKEEKKFRLAQLLSSRSRIAQTKQQSSDEEV